MQVLNEKRERGRREREEEERDTEREREIFPFKLLKEITAL